MGVRQVFTLTHIRQTCTFTQTHPLADNVQNLQKKIKPHHKVPSRLKPVSWSLIASLFSGCSRHILTCHSGKTIDVFHHILSMFSSLPANQNLPPTHQVRMEEEAKGWLVGCSFSSTSIAPQPKHGRTKHGPQKPCHGRGGAFLSPVFLLLLLLPAGLAHLLPEQGDATRPN